MKKFPNGAVNFILAAATVAPSLAGVSTFAQTPDAALPALALPGSLPTSNETPSDATLVAETVDAPISPDAALRQLIAGNARYLKGASDAANALPRLSNADARFPIATILYASDMPVKPDALTQTTDRDVYLTPIQAGAVASDDLAAVEYGVLNLRTPLLLVVGHYPSRDVSNLVRDFDALEKRAQAEAAKVSADRRITTDDAVPDDLKVYNLVGPAVARAREAYPDLQGYDLANVVSEALVWQSLETILLKSSVVQDLVRAGRLDVVAALADDKTGRLHWLGQHPLQEEFVKPLPEEYVLDETAAASADGSDGTVILTEDALSEPLAADAIQEYVERYENNAYYANYVDEYYRVPIYYEPSWELFDARAWTYRPWSGVWVDSFVPWPHYHPWGPPPGAAPGFGFSFVDGHLNFFIGFNRRPDGPRYVDPRFRPRDAWWGADIFVDPGRRPRDPIFDLIFGGRRHDIQPLPFDKRPGYRPGPAWRPGEVRPNDRPGAGRPNGYRPGGLTPIPVAPPGFIRPGGSRPGFDVRPGFRPGPDGTRPGFGNRPGAERPQIGNRPGAERPQIGNRPGAERPQIGNRPGAERPQIGNRPGAERPQVGNRPGAERPQIGNQPGAERPQIGNRPGAERPQVGNRPGTERPQIGNRPGNGPGAERPSGPNRGGRP